MGDTVVVRGNVTYTRRDKSTLGAPFANIFTMHDERVSRYLVYVDISAL